MSSFFFFFFFITDTLIHIHARAQQTHQPFYLQTLTGLNQTPTIGWEKPYKVKDRTKKSDFAGLKKRKERIASCIIL